MEILNVNYQNTFAGAVSFNTETGIGSFQYSNDFINQGIELSPVMMPLSEQIYSFPQLGFETYKGLPGLVADSLPDDFGNAILNAWVASQGKNVADITPLQRLEYTGKRGMGALEYAPAMKLKHLNASQKVSINSLVSIAQEILQQREEFNVGLTQSGKEDQQAMLALLSVGVSAGGARPKAILAFNNDFTEALSGQIKIPDGFTHYLMKFDGVSEHNKNKETFGDPLGYGTMEYVYYLMARSCGIDMMPCKLLDEGNRRHFVTQRFDRIGNRKVHVQTLNGLAHIDYKMPGSYSYAELFSLARKLRLTAQGAEQLLRRLVFNIVARNHDDHSKNFAFMLADNQWQLTPAYDLAYSYKPGSRWVNSHWMTLNGKRHDFNRRDFYSLEKISPLFSRNKINTVIEQTIEQLAQWPVLAKEHGVPTALIATIHSNLRLKL